MSAARNAQKKKKSSPDYPSLVRLIAEASRDAALSKLPAGLYIVATPIGNLGDISLRALRTLMQADYVACEDTRVGGALLAHYGIKKPLVPYHDHNADKMRPEIIRRLAASESVALISDAGLPLIADPGFKLVRDCREAGYSVTVIPGANAALTALVGSGLPTDAFYFAGFLPPKSAARKKALKELASISTTLIFYEARQRLADMLIDAAEILGEKRSAAVARELTKLFEETKCARLGELAGFYREHAVKGEITVVIGPPGKEAALDQDQLDDLLKKHMRGQSLKNAVKEISAITGIRRNEVYARALELQKKS